MESVARNIHIRDRLRDLWHVAGDAFAAGAAGRMVRVLFDRRGMRAILEGTGLPAMTPEHPFDIEGRRAELLGDSLDPQARRTGTARLDRQSDGSAKVTRCGPFSAARG